MRRATTSFGGKRDDVVSSAAPLESTTDPLIRVFPFDTVTVRSVTSADSSSRRSSTSRLPPRPIDTSAPDEDAEAATRR
jgi:hypothetical protein